MPFEFYDHVKGAILVRIRRFFLSLREKPDLSFINSNLAIGGSSSIKNLSKNGIQVVIDLRKEAQHNLQELENYSIQYFRIKISDRGVPYENDVYQTIEWIKQSINNDKKIFLHCNLGRGRAPMMACLYLISEGVNYDQAIMLVKKVRKYTYFNSKQLDCINNFYKTKK